MVLFTQLAPAKINLTLQVVGRRTDGYHLLDSLVAFTEYGDLIEAAAADALSLSIDGPFATALDGDSADNLVLRAARLLAEAAGIAPNASIRLIKNLPVASGIGGGSSDAAATLRALSTLWGLDLPPAELSALGLRLGADVPVCLAARTSRLQGIGEIVTPAPAVPAAATLLVNPGIGVRTPEVFRALNGAFSERSGGDRIPAEGVSSAAALAAILSACDNDLAAPAIALEPEIGRVLRHLAALPGCLVARMSGSGATCFALFADEVTSTAAAAVTRSTEPGWWVVATKLRSPEPAINSSFS